DLEGAELQRLRETAHLDLGGELDLGRAKAAEGAVRWRIRPRGWGEEPDVRAAIRAARVYGAAAQDDGREGAVRAAVHDDLDVLGDERPVGPHAGAVGDDRRVALRRGREVLVPVVDHPDRLPGLPREQCGMERDDRGVLLLAAEPAPRLRLDDPGLLVAQTERPLQ